MASVLSNKHLLLLLEHHKLMLLLLLMLQLLKHLSSLQEPLGVALDLTDKNLLFRIALRGLVFSLVKLLLVHLLVHPVHFSHHFDFVEVNHKATFISMVFLDALPAENGEVVGTVEMLHALVMTLAKQTVNAILVLEVDVSQDAVSLDDFVEDIEVQRQLVHTLDLLHQFSADGASHSVVVVQALKALSAEGMSAVNEDARYSLTHVELFSAIVAKVETSCLVISLDLLDIVVVILLFLEHAGGLFSALFESLVGAFGLSIT